MYIFSLLVRKLCLSGPSLLQLTAPVSYRFIPIIPLLREVTDWTMTRTSLRLKHYLTVQEIWAQLFLLSVYRRWERVSGSVRWERVSWSVSVRWERVSGSVRWERYSGNVRWERVSVSVRWERVSIRWE